MSYRLARCPKGNIHQAQLSSPYHVFLDGFDWRWLAVSTEFASLLGRNPSYLIGKSLPQLMSKGRYDSRMFDRLLQNESLQSECTFDHRDGKSVSVLASLRVLEDGCIVCLAVPK
jgi:PAS domain-containing protein